jgi:hypothetical protein
MTAPDQMTLGALRARLYWGATPKMFGSVVSYLTASKS